MLPSPMPVPRAPDEGLDAIGGALEPLAASLAPHKIVVECGGGGTCGPNSLARVLAHAKLHNGCGDDVRSRVIAHASKGVRFHEQWCEIEEMSVRELIESSFASWASPLNAVNRVGGTIDWGGVREMGRVLSAENWLKLMAKPTTWIDEAFLALAADCFKVVIQYSVVAGTGEIRGTCMLEPRIGVEPLAQVELAYVVDQHFCAIVPSAEGSGVTEPTAAASLPAPPSPTAAGARPAQHSPLTRRRQSRPKGRVLGGPL